MLQDNVGQSTGLSTANTPKVVPLLQSLGRVEELAQSLAIRLDPIVNHVPPQDKITTPNTTVTSRIHAVGDVLQYLLDNIEL